jgi:hypothetical protein
MFEFEIVFGLWFACLLTRGTMLELFLFVDILAIDIAYND